LISLELRVTVLAIVTPTLYRYAQFNVHSDAISGYLNIHLCYKCYERSWDFSRFHAFDENL